MARAATRTGKAPEAAKAGFRKVGPGTEPAGIEGVRLTHPDKVLWGDVGLTKQDLAEYYAAHADLILPHLKGRPLSIVRCPEGAGGECFFQKHGNPSTPASIDTVGIREKDGSTEQYLVVQTREGLIATAQIGALELHVWGCRADEIEKPERIVFDLDPDEGLDFGDVKEAAVEVRDVLKSVGLESFPMLTGGKGVHVIVPIARRNDWMEVKAFAHGFSEKLAAASPSRYVVNMSKKKRKGRIFLDYLRNERGSTAIAPYSPRRRDGAPVATPVSWAELGRIDKASKFTMQNLDARLKAQKRAPWPGYFSQKQTLTAKIRNAFA